MASCASSAWWTSTPCPSTSLAGLLKTRRLAEVGQRLGEHLLETPGQPLLASLNLSLERVPPAARQWLPRLGVFQGGAMEDVLLQVTGLGRTPADPEIAQAPPADLPPGVDDGTWPALREVLLATALIQAETLPGYNCTYLKFHPTLTQVLWPRLSPVQQADLVDRYRREYFQLSGELYHMDKEYPLLCRSVARRELPNLLRAVYGALDAREDFAVAFATSVERFLEIFGLCRDQAALTARVAESPAPLGSRDWFLTRSREGEQLYGKGRYPEAAQVFLEVLAALGEAPTHDRCLTLNRLGRCLRYQGRADLAAARYREALAVVTALTPSPNVLNTHGVILTDLADVLREMRDYPGARQAYEDGLKIASKEENTRGIFVANFKLGTLSLQEGDLQDALDRYLKAKELLEKMGEPALEAVSWHQLGQVYQLAGEWDLAEKAYREAARLKVSLNMMSGPNNVAKTWDGLGQVCKCTGKLPEAEAWYRKALAAFRAARDRVGEDMTLRNLAFLLLAQPGRLAEVLEIDKTLGQLLATIADREGNAE